MFPEAVNALYADYNYYINDYSGNEIKDEATFKRMLKRVIPILDSMTFNRVKKLEVIPDCVKDAICAMCETYAGLEVTGDDRKVTAENNDGFSQSFKEFDQQSINAQVVMAGRVYIANTGLLYKGVRRDDY